MRLQYTPQAIEDMKELQSYIQHNLQSPQAAVRISKKILDTCSMLQAHSKPVISLQSKIDREPDCRYLIIENCLAFYRITNSVISVVRVLDGRQDYLRLLFQHPFPDFY